MQWSQSWDTILDLCRKWQFSPGGWNSEIYSQTKSAYHLHGIFGWDFWGQISSGKNGSKYDAVPLNDPVELGRLGRLVPRFTKSSTVGERMARVRFLQMVKFIPVISVETKREEYLRRHSFYSGKCLPGWTVPSDISSGKTQRFFCTNDKRPKSYLNLDSSLKWNISPTLSLLQVASFTSCFNYHGRCVYEKKREKGEKDEYIKENIMIYPFKDEIWDCTGQDIKTPTPSETKDWRLTCFKLTAWNDDPDSERKLHGREIWRYFANRSYLAYLTHWNRVPHFKPHWLQVLGSILCTMSKAFNLIIA